MQNTETPQTIDELTERVVHAALDLVLRSRWLNNEKTVVNTTDIDHLMTAINELAVAEEKAAR